MLRLAGARLCALAFCAVLCDPFSAEAQPSTQDGSLEPAGYVDSNIQVTVMRARQIAISKLRSAACRKLFAEFRDLPGRSLEEVLGSREESAAQHLSCMVFRDGALQAPCERRGVYAFTSPGSSTVFVCPALLRLVNSEPRAAANLLIHEELHSLGAGEAPMSGLLSAEEITTRVEGRCGR